MAPSILVTKLFIPPTRPELVPRPRLIERLDAGLHKKLSLISAPAGFGKTTLVTEWLGILQGVSQNGNQIENKIAWLALDEGDNDPTRFLIYFIAALNKIEGDEAIFGKGMSGLLQSPQSPPMEVILPPLINEIAAYPNKIIFILDDYHLIESQAVHDILIFLLGNLPPQMHLVIATREDPHLSLPRLRARAQLTEMRAADLRFTSSEAAEFLNQVMRLNLSAGDIAALEKRTEGWIAGLQLAAISMQGHNDAANFIQSFTGSHHFVLDYLIEEVLQQQPESIQSFLLQTAVLDRLTDSLCDALTGQEDGQETLEYLQRSNLFIIPLDNERRWYRYHHLFVDLLRQRLHQHPPTSPKMGGKDAGAAELHIRASEWYEDNNLEIEAFQHAAAANDIARAERLVEGDGVPLQYRGAVTPVLNWLTTLPTTELDARPSLWVTYASALNLSGQPTAAEEKLQAAEVALQYAESDDRTNDIIGHIAAIRAMMAVSNDQIEIIIDQSQRALKYMNPKNLPMRTLTAWTLGYAYQLQGDLDAASQTYSDVLSISQVSGDLISTLAAATGLGSIQASRNQLYLAAESYRRGLDLFRDQPQPMACETCLGLARIFYEWNDLDAAEKHGQQSFELARQLENIDTFAVCGAFLAQVKLTQSDVDGAVALLAQAEQFMSQHSFANRVSEVISVRVLALIHQGDFVTATHIAKNHKLPISQARVFLAQGDASAALEVLELVRRQVEANPWEIERLKVMVLQAVALYAHGEKEKAAQLLGETLTMGEPGGFIRIFVDEGPPMQRLLYEVASRGIMPTYTGKLLAAFEIDKPGESSSPFQPLIEPLSRRELEVLQLVAEGLSNREISERLFLAVDTVKGHNRKIFGKLGVNSRAQAINKATSLKIITSR